MNIAPARSHLVVSLSCLFLAFGLLVVGCDSGGSSSSPNEQETLDNSSTVTVDLQSSSSGSSTTTSGEKAGAKASGALTVEFYYANDSGEDCNLSTTTTVDDSDLPYNEPFDPDPSTYSGSLSSECGSPADFDGVQVDFAPGSDFPTKDLVLTLLASDTEITSDDDPSDGFGVSETVSDDVDLPDQIGGGGDGGGGDGGGGDGGGGDPLSGTLTVEITGSNSQVSEPTVTVFYDLENGSCKASAGGTGASIVPYEETVDPIDDNLPNCPDGVSPDEFDGVRATATANNVFDPDQLNVKILSDGEVIAEGTEPNENDLWVAEYGFIPDSGNDDGGGTDADVLVPVKDGNKWEADFADGSEEPNPGPATLEATSDNQIVAFQGGSRRVTTTISQGSNGLIIESVSTPEEGVTQRDVMRFKYPAQDGESYDHTDGDGTTRTITVSRTTVTVQAGTFENCLQYSVDGNQTVTFKPGVGPVRWSDSEGGFNRELTSTNVTP